MSTGLEIDMYSVGDADSLLVSVWNGNAVHRVLIDGGNKGDAEKIRTHLRNRKITRIDDVLSTHLHDDHSRGLIEILEDETLTVGKLWSHVPQWHVESMERVNIALRAAGQSNEADSIRKSLSTSAEIFRAAKQRGIAHEEPFEDKRIGPLQVLSPSVEFYSDLVAEFVEADKIKAEDQAAERYESQTGLQEAFAKALGLEATSTLLDDPHTSPENESSVVTGFKREGGVYLFTGDAGCSALSRVAATYPDVASLRWMQIPHHGSRRNLTPKLIDKFAPNTAYVSASGNQKHPRRAVVNAFKKFGSVYSTHYPTSTNLYHSWGDIPARPEYSTATPLYEEKKLQKSEPPVNALIAAMGTRR